MKMVKYFIALCTVLLLQEVASCQQKDTTGSAGTNHQDSIPAFIKGETPNPNRKLSKPVDSPYKTDSLTRKRHDPRRATLYSTFLPGLGQVYNKKYWKLPLVGAALGIPAYFYFSNKQEYKNTVFAISVVVTYFGGDTVVPIPANVLNKVEPTLRTLVSTGADNVLRGYRNQVRQNQDYSVLFFLLFWGLQIVDATVDAHLKDFNVSDDLSFRLAPSSESMHLAGGGLSLVFDMHKARRPMISLP
jgi:hypothetical protein